MKLLITGASGTLGSKVFEKLNTKNSKNLNISFVTKKKLGNAVKRNKIRRRFKPPHQKYLDG